MNILEKTRELKKKVSDQEGGVLPYAIAWWLGVPLVILLIVFLIRGH